MIGTQVCRRSSILPRAQGSDERNRTLFYCSEVVVIGMINQKGLVASAKHVSRQPMAAVQRNGVGAEQPAHSFHKIWFGCLD
jgi:hypothetical protein